MRILRTYYEIMGLDKSASKAEVRSRYHELARQFHPDRAKDKVLAQRHFTQINLAYKTLYDAQKRAAYDASLTGGSVSIANGSNGAAPVGQKQPQPKTDPMRSPKTEPIGQNPSRPTGPTPAAAPTAPKLTLEEALLKANAAYMSGDRRAAQQLCINIIKADPRNTSARVLLGDIYSELGQRVEALSEYRSAVSAGDNSMLVQGKIKRLETQSGMQPKPGVPAPGQRPPPSAPTPAQKRPPEPPKKTSIFDRIIGRGK